MGNEGHRHLDIQAAAEHLRASREIAAVDAQQCTICGRVATEPPHTNPTLFVDYHRFAAPSPPTPPALRQLTRSDCEFSYSTREHDAPPTPSGIGVVEYIALLDAFQRAAIDYGARVTPGDLLLSRARAAVEAQVSEQASKLAWAEAKLKWYSEAVAYEREERDKARAALSPVEGERDVAIERLSSAIQAQRQTIIGFEDRVASLTEALRFYADPESWRFPLSAGDDASRWAVPATADNGGHARAALGSSGGGASR